MINYQVGDYVTYNIDPYYPFEGTVWGNVYGIIKVMEPMIVTIELHRKDDHTIIPSGGMDGWWTSSTAEFAGFYARGGQFEFQF